ncbi:MAG: CoA transferase [Candidatus Eremiobacteraeota bacterium]|nr:CoA transferase [Candidatus Eremiobacteraeota bacterium]
MAALKVVAVATNIPGPLAAEHFARTGAEVVKIEPPAGDALAAAAPEWYARISSLMRVERLDLRSSDARSRLETLLARADLLLTAMRPAALERLGLDARGCERFPMLCHVAISGDEGELSGRAGHDLTYQASSGLLSPPAMPRTVFADMFAAEGAVAQAYALLYRREREGRGGFAGLSIAAGAAMLADASRYGLTSAGGPLSGASPMYCLYRAADGWVALAALEPHFQANLRAALGAELDGESLQREFAARTCEQCEQLARDHDIPLATVT